MRRVLMTTDAIGGVWNYTLALARGLVSRRVSTTLAVLGPSPDAQQAAAATAIPDLVLIDTGAPLDWLATSTADVVVAAETVAELARSTDACIVQLNSPTLAALATFGMPVVGVCHSCLATWWDAMRNAPMPDDFRRRTTLLTRGYAACDALVAPSVAFANAMAAHYRVKPRVVHNGSSSVPLAACCHRESVVLTAGRLWDEAKNVTVLDVAASLVNAPVFVAGPQTGPDGSSCDLEHVIPLGRLGASDLRVFMHRSRVFTSIARYEPFGLAVLEAAQAGCALVLSDIASFRELWDGAALFVPAHDPVAVASALQRVVADDALAANLALAAERRARQYTESAMVNGMCNVYWDVLTMNRSAGRDRVVA